MVQDLLGLCRPVDLLDPVVLDRGHLVGLSDPMVPVDPDQLGQSDQSDQSDHSAPDSLAPVDHSDPVDHCRPQDQSDPVARYQSAEQSR